MAIYRIPENHIIVFNSISKYSTAQFKALINALKALKKSEMPSAIAETLEGLDFIDGDVTDLFSAIVSLFDLKYKSSKPLGELIDDVFLSINSKSNNIKQGKNTHGRNSNLKTRLIELLSIDSIGTIIKVFSLYGEYDKVYSSNRIITDLRPAFIDMDAGIDGALIIHNLKIEYQANNKFEEFFVALNSDELVELRQSIERAEMKEKIIREKLGKSIFITTQKKKSI